MPRGRILVAAAAALNLTALAAPSHAEPNGTNSAVEDNVQTIEQFRAKWNNLIDRAAIEAMKAGAIFVNVARGNMVDEPALIEALEAGRLAGAALDVARDEPLPPGSSLWDVPNLLISPHSSPSQDRYFEMVFELFVDNLGRYVSGQPLRNVVDLKSGY